MHAIVATRHGGPEVLELVDLPTPAPGPGQVLVRVEAAAVNFADVMRRRDDLYPFPTTLPYRPGSEVAGTVEALGEGVTGPPVGTPVFALVGGDGSTGYSQYAVADAAMTIPVPPGLDLDAAAGLVVAGTTAVLVLTEVLRTAAGSTLLVEGAGGGVGSYAVQVGTHLGARVVGLASTAERRSAATRAGAVAAFDPADPAWPDRVREVTGGAGADGILHVSGPATFAGALRALAPFGTLAVVGTASGAMAEVSPEVVRPWLYDPAPNQVVAAFNLGLWFGMRPQQSAAALERLIGLVASGVVTVPVGHTLPLREAATAHRLLEERGSTGKVVLKPWAG